MKQHTKRLSFADKCERDTNWLDREVEQIEELDRW